MNDISLSIAIFAGALSFLSPCVLPLVPSYLIFLSGAGLEELKGNQSAVRRKALITALFFVCGFSLVFIALGASASLIGNIVRVNSDIFSIIAGILIIIMGLHFIGLFKIPFLMRTMAIDSAPRAGYLGGFMMGMSFGFGWTPCIGPILASILALAAVETTVTKGVMLLAGYSLGLGVPFMLAALLINPFLRLLTKLKSKMELIEKGMGVLLILTGIMFLTGSINTLSFWLLDIFPALGKIG
jgi:cytochrome c-type biogenesis protein